MAARFLWPAAGRCCCSPRLPGQLQLAERHALPAAASAPRRAHVAAWQQRRRHPRQCIPERKRRSLSSRVVLVKMVIICHRHLSRGVMSRADSSRLPGPSCAWPGLSRLLPRQHCAAQGGSVTHNATPHSSGDNMEQEDTKRTNTGQPALRGGNHAGGAASSTARRRGLLSAALKPRLSLSDEGQPPVQISSSHLPTALPAVLRQPLPGVVGISSVLALLWAPMLGFAARPVPPLAAAASTRCFPPDRSP